MRYRIPIADDDPQVTRFAARAPSHAGSEVLVAENGKPAMEVAAEKRGAPIGTGLFMQEMEGPEMVGRFAHIAAAVAWARAAAGPMNRSTDSDSSQAGRGHVN